MRKHLRKKAGELLRCLQAGIHSITFAESCTGGMLASYLTACPGASHSLEMGFVTYSDRAKTELLGVAPELLEDYTAVSAPVAAAMAKGAKARSGADLALAVTGWAGPDGLAEDWPVGLVYIGAAWQDEVHVWRYQFPGNRQMVREQATLAAFRHGIQLILAS